MRNPRAWRTSSPRGVWGDVTLCPTSSTRTMLQPTRQTSPYKCKNCNAQMMMSPAKQIQHVLTRRMQQQLRITITQKTKTLAQKNPSNWFTLLSPEDTVLDTPTPTQGGALYCCQATLSGQTRLT